MISNKMQINKKTKALILALIVVILVCCFIPLYEACIYQQRQFAIARTSQEILSLEEDIRVLNAKISYSRSPEALINQVVEQQLDYRNIDYSTSFRIAKAN
jgi:hypothetical protein